MISYNGLSGMSGASIGWAGGGSLVLCLYGSSLDVVNYICIDARPVNCISGFALHIFCPQMCTVEVSEGMVKELGGCRCSLPSGEYWP